MKLYNTRTRNTEAFTPYDTPVRVYSCGPTVYDHAHIGNLSAFIFADTLRRVLKIAGYDVTHAMNYTDVDDKTIRRSHEKYPNEDPKAALRKLTDEYITIFLEDMQRIGNDTAALTFMRATNDEIIEGMRELITKLYKNGFAYVADDGVYFSIDAYRKSGKVYGQLLDLTFENTSEARIQNDEYDKDSVHDFALWKKQKDSEPAWEFTIDGHSLAGRPGWHIECSVMSRQALSQPFDIHTGGIDLMFPHHENEIAQSTACETNPIMANFFVHNEHILVDGKKMSKSAHNFYTLQDIIDKGYNPLAFRLLVLQSHYRNQTHFSWDNLEAAQNRLKRFQNFAVLRYQGKQPSDTASTMQPEKEISLALENDLNTPQALAALEAFISSTEEDDLSDEKFLLTPFIQYLDDAFGLQLLTVPDISEDQKQMVAKRETARQSKEWATSDQLRDKLAEQGIGVRDTKNGPIWYRI